MTHVIIFWVSMKTKNLLSSSTAIILALIALTLSGFAAAENPTQIELTDLTGTAYTFTYTQLLAMPKTEVAADLYCDGALVTYGAWSGVALQYLLSQGQLTAQVCSVQFTASDGYQVAIPIDLAVSPQIIVAYELNGQPLSEGLRLVIPDANGAAWISQITVIAMSTSGAAYPQSISVGITGASNVAPTPQPTTKPAPTQQENPRTPQPVTPQNASTIAPPTPTTQPTEKATNPQASTQSLNMQATGYLIVVALAVSFTAVATGFVVHKRKHAIK